MYNTNEYEEFLQRIAERVEEHYEGKMRPEIVSTLKNNSVVMKGIMFREETEPVSPNFYLEREFWNWREGRETMEEIISGLMNAYEEEKEKNKMLLEKIQFTWECFRENVFLRLINRDRNKERLEQVPYREFLDMAVVYYFSIAISDTVAGSMLITKEHLETLGISEEELYDAAEENTRTKHQVVILKMNELLEQLQKKMEIEFETVENSENYVLTNENRTYGAVTMMFREGLRQFSDEIGNSFYILPSSIHEVILMPDNGEMDVEFFACMVKRINRTAVLETEVLSDSIYYYDRGMGQIRRIM